MLTFDVELKCRGTYTVRSSHCVEANSEEEAAEIVAQEFRGTEGGEYWGWSVVGNPDIKDLLPEATVVEKWN